jgi:hypothetical protein
MKITCREIGNGLPVGAGHTYADAQGVVWVLDNWCVGTDKVYARRQKGDGGLVEFDPEALGLYIGPYAAPRMGRH